MTGKCIRGIHHSCSEVNPEGGKTSLIHSLAGKLGLDIYVVSLSSKVCVFGPSPHSSGDRMSDNTVTTPMGNVPSQKK